MTDLNLEGESFAHSLIAAGKVDRTSDWSFSSEEGNKLLGAKGDDWNAYGKAHLGLDRSANENTKGRFKYPLAKGGKLYRSALVAIRSRAGQQNENAIEKAAGDLMQRVDAAEKKSNGSTHEQRHGLIEIRAMDPDGDGDAGTMPTKMLGYAARFNSPTDIGGMFMEQVAPGAFSQSINEDDIRALFNHDPNMVLGRNRAGTLKLSEDAQGLMFECTPPESMCARDLMMSIQRGDINQCSFSFDALQEEWDFSGDMPSRTLKQCRLYDISAVTYPAYADTSVAARSLDAAKAELELQRRRHNFNAASMRVKLKTKLELVRRSLSV